MIRSDSDELFFFFVNDNEWEDWDEKTVGLTYLNGPTKPHSYPLFYPSVVNIKEISRGWEGILW